jgi:hypothetical protein
MFELGAGPVFGDFEVTNVDARGSFKTGLGLRFGGGLRISFIEWAIFDLITHYTAVSLALEDLEKADSYRANHVNLRLGMVHIFGLEE